MPFIIPFRLHDPLTLPQASQHGNTDAAERLTALSQPAPVALSRQEHDNLTETTLVRKRTQAKQRSDASGRPAAGLRPEGRQNGQQVVANIRKNSLAYRPPPNPGNLPPPAAAAVPTRSDNPPVVGGPPVNEGGYGNSNPYRQSNLNAEGFPPQRQPPPQSGTGFRPPSQQVTGPLHPHQSSLPPPQPHSSLPPPQPQSSLPLPGSGPGYPSPRPPAQQQQYGQLGRPTSQAFGPGGPGRRTARTRTSSGPGAALGPPGGGGGGAPPQTSAPVPGPSPPGVYDPPMKPPGPKGPATFQEMGFQSQKLEENNCVIM